MKLTHEKKKCFKRYFDDVGVMRQVNIEFANFSNGMEGFVGVDSLRDKGKMNAKLWWIVHGAHAPTPRNITLKVLGQPCSSSCYEKNTYSFIHSLKINNKMTSKRVDSICP